MNPDVARAVEASPPVAAASSGVPLLRVDDLVVSYPAGTRHWRGTGARVRVVDRVDLTVHEGEVLALVGESGCGKTSLARGIAGLLKPESGRVLLGGKDVTGFGARADARDRAAVQMVFQDPFESLNPRKTIMATLSRPLRLNAVVPHAEVGREVARLLVEVGLPVDALHRYPHEFSGGQRQRIGIARAIATRPRLLIADEAVSALDISIRAQLLRLLAMLRARHGLAILFITHDLGVVRSFADRVAVMYLGQVVEEGPTDAVFAAPAHPYTRALLQATPVPDPVVARTRQRIPLTGDVPGPRDVPAGCRFHPRCPDALAECARATPTFVRTATGARARCLRVVRID